MDDDTKLPKSGKILRNNEELLFYFIKKTPTIPFVILLFVELFPLKTSGSFFSTNNATYIFFLMAFIISFIEMMEKKSW